MSTLFLASSFDKTIDKFIEKVKPLPDQAKVAFIDSAADPYRDSWDLFWVENDRKAFLDNGFKISEVNLHDFKNLSETEIENFLSGFDILHMCGGHTKYLMYLIHINKFYRPLKEFILSGKLIYTGTSAGSMVVAPSLAEVGRLDDEIDVKYWPEHNQEHLQGLSLVDFLILPHFNNPDFIESNYESIKSTNYPHPLIFLNDNQAILAQNGKFEIVQ
ncbi:MAG: Type 1 glutamine amidotransferase-like domain-containing protein [Patescibacteria group bacterium]